MSNVGKKPLSIPSGVDIKIHDGVVKVKGPKGELSQEILPGLRVEIEGNVLRVKREKDDKVTKSYHGLLRRLIGNMVEGVTKGFEKRLEVHGIGYRVEKAGKAIKLTVGYSHPVIYEPPPEVEVSVEGNNVIVVRGIDKQKVGQVAAEIRAVKPPDPYKGKGIRYAGEVVRLKAGKTKA